MSANKKKFDLSKVDFNNVGSWPDGLKYFACFFLVVLILAMFYYFEVAGQRETLEGLERNETSLKSTFVDKQGRAANLEPLKIQLAQMEEMLQQMLRQLPGKTEMPDLIVDISQTALATGIVNQLFKPGTETPKEFYAEKPINLRMLGTYHQFGSFMSGVASLPRVVILTMHDISLKPANKGAGIGEGALVLEGTVKTYRYLDEDDQASAQPAKGKKGRAAPKADAAAAPAASGGQ